MIIVWRNAIFSVIYPLSFKDPSIKPSIYEIHIQHISHISLKNDAPKRFVKDLTFKNLIQRMDIGGIFIELEYCSKTIARRQLLK